VLSTIAQMLSVPAALAAPLLTARSGCARPIFWGTLGMALCILPLALIPHWTAADLGFVSSGALFSTSIGPIRVYSQELVTPEWRPAMAPAFMMGAGLAFSGMSLLGGYAITSLGYRPLFLIGTVLATAGAFLFWFCFRVPRGELARQPVPGSRE
jgi:MFS family permease